MSSSPCRVRKLVSSTVSPRASRCVRAERSPVAPRTRRGLIRSCGDATRRFRTCAERDNRATSEVDSTAAPVITMHDRRRSKRGYHNVATNAVHPGGGGGWSGAGPPRRGRRAGIWRFGDGQRHVGIPGCNGAVEVDAHSGPNGENPTGQVDCGTLFSGPVTCLSVNGNVACSTSCRRSSAPSASGSRTSRPAIVSRPSRAIGCPTPLTGYVELGFTGDLVVVDGRALPTSKDQCKKGGWQTTASSRTRATA